MARGGDGGLLTGPTHSRSSSGGGSGGGSGRGGRLMMWGSGSYAALEAMAAEMDNNNGKGLPVFTQQGFRGTQAAASLGSAVLYAVVAIAMNFVNKATLNQFPHAYSLLLAQMVSALCIIYPLKFARVVKLPPLSLRKSRVLWPVCFCYNANTAFALMGLQNLNVPMYSTLKRLTPMIVLSSKAVMTGKLPPKQVTGAVLVVVLGCFIAGMGDFSFNLRGYIFALMSCSLQASYLLLVEHSGAEKGVGSLELLVYNSVLSIPFLLLMLAFTGELWTAAGAFQRVWSAHPHFPALFMLCAAMGCLLNFSLVSARCGSEDKSE